MFCEQCGAKLSEDMVFCEKCGTKIAAPVEQDKPKADETVRKEPETQFQQEEAPPKQQTQTETATKQPQSEYEMAMRKIIGKNADYYLERFNGIRNKDKNSYRNLVNDFFGLPHSVYRNMGKDHFAKIKTPTIIGAIGGILTAVGAPLDIRLVAIPGFVMAAVGLTWFVIATTQYSNKFNEHYMNHVEEKIKNRDYSPDISKNGYGKGSLAISAIELAYIVLVLGLGFGLSHVAEERKMAKQMEIIEEVQQQETQEEADIAVAEPEPEPEPEKDDTYILSQSDKVYVTAVDLQGFDKNTAMLARNEIFARHGYVFSDADIKAYFEGKAWYQPDLSFTTDMLSKIEQENIATIQNYEEQQGWVEGASMQIEPIPKEQIEYHMVMDLNEALTDYIYYFMEAVNSGDASYLDRVLVPGSEMEKQQKKVVESLAKQGIYEEGVSCGMKDYEIVDDTHAKAISDERIMVYYADGTSKEVHQSYTYYAEYWESVGWMFYKMVEN